MSQVIYSGNVLVFPVQSFLPSIVAEVTSRLRNAEKKKEFSRQHLANYVSKLPSSHLSCRKANPQHSHGVHAVVSKPPKWPCLQIWALAVVDYNPGQLSLRTLLDTLQERVHDCNPQELSNIVWACAKLQLYDANFLDLYAEEAASRMDEFGGQNLVSVNGDRIVPFCASIFKLCI